ncbi:RxLR effector protein [Phytophthora megakarya]|uniref:RxLR effector protein n=1 Tax=Phytophthora megakarya TaxID=4795 RepID=A0A225WZP1_9STRA|nr:RxLR effector protein [Phytophthora megakarya]
MAAESISVDEVFSLLKLKDEGINLFKSQKLETMDEYIKLFKLNDPQKVLYNALAKAYDGEYNTAILISGAMGNKPTSEGASRFQQIQFQRWISMNYDPTSVLSKVFKIHSNDLAAPTNNLRAQEKSIVAAYTSAYNKAMGIDKADDVLLSLTMNTIMTKAYSFVADLPSLLTNRILRVHNNPSEEERMIGAVATNVVAQIKAGALTAADFVKLRTWLYHQKSVHDVWTCF